MEARCQCSAVILTCPSAEPLAIYACHCTACRRQSGSAFGVSAGFRRFDFLSQAPGKLGEYAYVAPSGTLKRCYFCTACGSRLINASDGLERISVKGGCLTGLTKEMMKGVIHIWTKEAVIDIPDGAVRWDEEPIRK